MNKYLKMIKNVHFEILLYDTFFLEALQMRKKWVTIGFILLLACCLLTACNTARNTQETKMSAIERVKIVKIPAGKMIKTPEFRFDDGTFFPIMKKLWTQVVDRHEKDIFYRDLMVSVGDTGKNFWMYSVSNLDIGKFDTEGFEIIDFEGGYYATTTTIDPGEGNMESVEKAIQEVKDWVTQSNGFELDFGQNRYLMSQMCLADDEAFKKAMGYEQNQVFIPIKIKK